VAWAQSDPFDIGNATAGALLGHSVEEPAALKMSVLKAARQFNLESKANGSLMRASALGVWASKVSFGEAVLSARLNAELTHPNPSCIHANAAYVVAIRHLILAPGDTDDVRRSESGSRFAKRR
jgi:ADP-ribosylglycohydrolase